MWRIIATHTREGREIARKEIDVGEVTIGRDADRGLVLQSASVSRRHCKIRVDHTGATITDEGSANGVLVNGVRINPNTPAPIGPGLPFVHKPGKYAKQSWSPWPTMVQDG